ncbi:MAG: hypothetical protein JW728_00080 [Candidatus Aureabacteria bacterium]|nr:hypothetical protein [Candidatus Auribacterota bacterium]
MFLMFIVFLSAACAAHSGENRFTDSREQSVYEWFCLSQGENGLFQSAEGVDICSTYQLSTAAMVFTLYGDYDRAGKIFDYFLSKQAKEFSAPSITQRGFLQMRHPSSGEADWNSYRWVGDNSWLLMALNFYKSRTGSRKYDSMMKAIADWLCDMRDKEGNEIYETGDFGLWYGFTGDGRTMLRAKSSEGNLDAYAALAPFKDKAGARAEIKKFLDSMYVAGDRRIKIGTTVSTTDSELQAWAYLVFGDENKYPLEFLEKNYRLTVTSEATGEEITGFSYMPEDHMEGRLELSCTIEIVSAFQAMGDKKREKYYLSETEKAMIESRYHPGTYGLPGLANKSRWPNDPTDMRGVNVHSSAWYLFVKKGFNPFSEFKF